MTSEPKPKCENCYAYNERGDSVGICGDLRQKQEIRLANKEACKYYRKRRK